MRESFNIYHFFAGAFVPYWLMSRREISAGAKLAYALLAQQANSRGAVQLHFRLQAAALGCDEGQLARHLAELEEVGLVRTSRGNVNVEDVRVFFPAHPWMGEMEHAQQGGTLRAVPAESIFPTLPFPDAAAPAQNPSPVTPAVGAGDRAGVRDRRWRKRKQQPHSKHPREVCLRYVTYQKEVLRHDHIRNVMALANHIYVSGAQDAEIDAWLAGQRRDAA